MDRLRSAWKPRAIRQGKIELSGAELEDVRTMLLRAIDREQPQVDAGLRDQGVEFAGTITVSADGEVTMPEDDHPPAGSRR
jgi:hypothetical protein